MTERSVSTMECQIWKCLPEEARVRAVEAFPMTPKHVWKALPCYTFRSIRSAMYRLNREGRLYMERDGREFMYARKTGAKPPVDGRGGAR